MRKYLVLTVSLLLIPRVHPAYAAEMWKVEAIKLKPGAGPGRSEFTAIAVDPTGGKRVELSARIPLETIDDSFVTGDKLILIGDAHRPQAVVILDITLGQPIDWFYCYSPRRISEKWIAYVEFYFPHVAGGEPTDVVLVYDLGKTPLENRLEREPGMKLPPSELDRAAVHVGTPVYPESNASRKSYRNLVTDTEIRSAVLGQGGYALVGANKLVFPAAEGGEASAGQRNHLVVVNLSRGLEHAVGRRVEIPTYRFRRTGPSPGFVVVRKIEAVSSSAVRLYVPESEYGVSSIVVDIPQ